MEEKEVYQGTVNAFTEKPKFTLTIPVTWRPEPAAVALPKQSLWDRLTSKQVKSDTEQLPDTETFVIKPCKVVNMARLAGAAVALPDQLKEGTLAEIAMPLVKEHLPTIVYIVAAGIQNDHNEPEPELITFIERNFDNDDLYAALYPVLENSGMQSFLNSIVLAKGTVSLLKPKASPTDGSE
jgi:hypothetical protein